MSDGQATFVLDRFRLAQPGRLEVRGSWDAVNGVDLGRALLVLHVEGRVDQVEADVVRRSTSDWHAEFAWNGDPAAIRQAALEVGGSLVVELEPQPSAAPSVARRDEPALPDGNIVSLHAALVAAQEQLADAEAEVEAAREDARRAREDAERERARRRHEAERLHEALESLQQVADEALAAKAAELHSAGQALARADAAAAGYRDEAGAAQARIRALEDSAAKASAEAEELEAELEQARELARRTAHALERADEEALENRRLRETVRELEQALADARRAGAAAADELAQLRDRFILIRDALGDDD
jgi:DNA repair exonuclease SbcCD ATPase subunit